MNKLHFSSLFEDGVDSIIFHADIFRISIDTLSAVNLTGKLVLLLLSVAEQGFQHGKGIILVLQHRKKAASGGFFCQLSPGVIEGQILCHAGVQHHVTKHGRCRV